MKDALTDTDIGISPDNVGILHESLYEILSRETFMVTALYSLSSHGKKIYSIPLCKTAHDLSIIKVNTNNTFSILRGKIGNHFRK